MKHRRTFLIKLALVILIMAMVMPQYAMATIVDGAADVTIDATASVTVTTPDFTVDGATTLDGTLDVTGTTSLSTLGTSGLATLNSASVTTILGVTGATTLSDTLDVTGTTSLSTLGTSGLATLNSASVTTTLGVTGATTLSDTLNVTGATTLNDTLDVTGATTLNDTLDVTGATTLNDTLDVTGATTLNDTLDVTGATTLNGGETVHNGSTIWSGNGAGNQMVVDGTSSRFVSADTYSNATVSNGSVSLVADNDGSAGNGRSALSMAPTNASLLVNNASTGESHGIRVGQTSTVVSGGTDSTSLTLDDTGATFRNDTTGGPARVTGVADGKHKYDAVNMRQYRQLEDRLDKSYAGIAAVSAIAAVPPPVPGKNFSVGMGYGNFENQNAMAVGAKALVGEERTITLSVGVGVCDDTSAFSGGVGWSF